jgi:hypothetical protein
MDDPFWMDLARQLGVNAIILAVAGVVLKRWLESSMAKRAAEKGLIELKDEIIKMKDEINRQQLMEYRRRDGEWQEKLDKKEKEFMEFRRKTNREFEIQRKVSAAMNRDLKLVNTSGGNVPEERLETAILITGLGPLDRDD